MKITFDLFGLICMNFDSIWFDLDKFNVICTFEILLFIDFDYSWLIWMNWDELWHLKNDVWSWNVGVGVIENLDRNVWNLIEIDRNW